MKDRTIRHHIRQDAMHYARHRASSRRRLRRAAILVCLILACDGRAGAPLRSRGRLALYGGDRGSDPGIVLHRWGREAWGFLEWPDRGIYCLIEARELAPESYDGRIVAGTASGSGIEMKIGERGRVLEIEISGGAVPDMRLSQSQAKPGALPELVGYRAGRGDRHSAVLIADPAGSSGGFWDARLRRGLPPREYSAALFSQAEARGKGGGAGIEERQTLVYLGDGLVSALNARSRIFGSTEETSTSSLTADLGETDAFGAPGRILETRDVFREGWEGRAATLLREEALRLLSREEGVLSGTGAAENSAGKTGASLRERGFFEEEPRPSSSFFLCRSGAGFHYDLYELGPASLGQIILVIPWARLAPILKDGSPVPRP